MPDSSCKLSASNHDRRRRERHDPKATNLNQNKNDELTKAGKGLPFFVFMFILNRIQRRSPVTHVADVLVNIASIGRAPCHQSWLLEMLKGVPPRR